MDKFLYIIRDHLPKAAVADLHKFIGKIKSVKSITDMKAYLVIVSILRTNLCVC